MNVTGRFAPSPSGYLHMGNLLSMLLVWLDCRSLGGELVFRMEDLDPARSKEEYILAMGEDLRWLGLDWDRGWPDPEYAQSRRSEHYEAAFRLLEEQGLIYPCWCSRSRRLAAASAPHPGEAQGDRNCPCGALSPAQRWAMASQDRPPAWKLRVPNRTLTVPDGHYGSFALNPARDTGDCILRRSDGVWAYQLAVCVDDLLMGVNRVVRGRDLLSSAPVQAWLIEKLGGTAPEYCHGPLLTAGQGKLSKRLGSLSTQALRRSVKPEELTGRLAFLAGLIDREEPLQPRELLPVFSWDKVKTEDIPQPD